MAICMGACELARLHAYDFLEDRNKGNFLDYLIASLSTTHFYSF